MTVSYSFDASNNKVATFSGLGELTQTIVSSDLSGATQVIIQGYTSIDNFAFVWRSNLTSVTIPSSVTTIGDYAFNGCSELTSISIPSSVTSIGMQAFDSCSKLASVTIQSSTTTIGYVAFNGCTGITSFTIQSNTATISIVNGSKVATFSGSGSLTQQFVSLILGNATQVVIQGYTDISNNAFASCSALTSVTIPSSVTTIGSSAFYGCTSLASITIPSSVTTIGSQAFQSCTSLASITIQSSTTTIDSSTFNGCTGITSFTIQSNTATISIVNGSKVATFSGSGSLTQQFVSLILGNATQVIIQGYTDVSNNAFFGRSALTSVTIPSSVTTIGDSAFSSCSALTSVTIPSSVTTISQSAFANCSALTSVTIPSSVTTIGNYAFEICKALTSITIPASVTTFGFGVFSSCSALTYIVILSSITQIGDYAFYGCSSLVSITIPASITSIGDYAFYGCSSLVSITIPASVTTIGSRVFAYCSSLISIEIPAGVTTIKRSAFAYCTSLTSITLPEGVTTIGQTGCLGCSALVSIKIPSSVTDISGNAFNLCSSLKTVYLPQNNKLNIAVPNPSYYFYGVTVELIPPEIPPTIGALIIESKTYGAPPFTINDPSSNSNGRFSYTSSDTSVATIYGKTVTILKVGTTDITTTQEPSGNYTLGTTPTTTFTVNKATPNFVMLSNITKVYGSEPFTITNPSSNSPGAFSYTCYNTNVADISGNVVTIVGAGDDIITARQLETDNFFSLSKTSSINVYKSTSTNPVNLNNSNALLYYINETTATYANIIDSLQIPDSLKTSSSSKVLFTNQDGVKITRSE